jgi:hypothetical protein
MPPKINHQYLTKNSLIAMTSKVGAGRSAPNDVKTLLKSWNHEDHDDRHHDEGDHDQPSDT